MLNYVNVKLKLSFFDAVLALLVPCKFIYKMQVTIKSYTKTLYSGADLHKDDGIYSRYLPYHRSNRSIPILIEARDSLTKAYVVNTSISFEDGDTEDKLSKYNENNRMIVINQCSMDNKIKFIYTSIKEMVEIISTLIQKLK